MKNFEQNCPIIIDAIESEVTAQVIFLLLNFFLLSLWGKDRRIKLNAIYLILFFFNYLKNFR